MGLSYQVSTLALDRLVQLSPEIELISLVIELTKKFLFDYGAFVICDLRSFGSCRIKGTDESTLDKDLSIPLMRHDPNDLRSQIRFRILPKNAPYV